MGIAEDVAEVFGKSTKDGPEITTLTDDKIEVQEDFMDNS